MKKLCYKSDGTAETFVKIIGKLLMSGGVVSRGLCAIGDRDSSCYFINYRGEIECNEAIPSGYTLANLDDEVPFEAMVWDDDESNTKQRVVFNIDENLYYPVCCYSGIECVSDISKGKENPVHFKHYRKIERNPTEQIKSKLIEITNLINQIL